MSKILLILCKKKKGDLDLRQIVSVYRADRDIHYLPGYLLVHVKLGPWSTYLYTKARKLDDYNRAEMLRPELRVDGT